MDSTPDGAVTSIAAVSAQTRQEHVPGLVRDSSTDDGLGELFLWLRHRSAGPEETSLKDWEFGSLARRGSQVDSALLREVVLKASAKETLSKDSGCGYELAR